MSKPLVVFDGVSKKFRRGERHDSLRDFIPSLARRLLKGSSLELEKEEFWAVRNVSFEVHAGQALGIIGPNGAGKSTTLKLLTKILRPTLGTSLVRGRVGALIEVAAGFHPDLTGRENIYLQGAIMGMKRAAIERQLDAIVDFAGLSEFVETPVKRYSSGMNARLGFSIAAHLEPHVMIIDEVLAVGDMAFQQRCLDRMLEFKHRGVAIVFVSHNLQAVANLCDQALHLNHEVRDYGSPETVIEGYVRAAGESQTATAMGDIEIAGAEILGYPGETGVTANPGTPMTLRVTYTVHRPLRDLSFGFRVIRSTDNLLVYDANFRDDELQLTDLRPGRQFAVDFRFRANMTRGQYHLASHVFHNPTDMFVSRLSPIGMLRVTEDRTHSGIADVALEASCVETVTSREAAPFARR